MIIMLLSFLSFLFIQEGVYHENHLPGTLDIYFHVKCQNYVCVAQGGGISIQWVQTGGETYQGTVTDVKLPLIAKAFKQAEGSYQKQKALSLKQAKGILVKKGSSESSNIGGSAGEQANAGINKETIIGKEIANSREREIHQQKLHSLSETTGKDVNEDMTLLFVKYLKKKLSSQLQGLPEIKQWIETLKYIFSLYILKRDELEKELIEFYIEINF